MTDGILFYLESKKRATEDTPAKLLDDLFQKTKSVPCIYWLPLTEEQVSFFFSVCFEITFLLKFFNYNLNIKFAN